MLKKNKYPFSESFKPKDQTIMYKEYPGSIVGNVLDY